MNLSPEIHRGMRETLAPIERAIRTVSQVVLADKLGEGKSTFSEFKNDHLERLAAMLFVCGLKVVPITNESVTQDELMALRVLAGMQVTRKVADSGFGSL